MSLTKSENKFVNIAQDIPKDKGKWSALARSRSNIWDVYWGLVSEFFLSQLSQVDLKQYCGHISKSNHEWNKLLWNFISFKMEEIFQFDSRNNICQFLVDLHHILQHEAKNVFCKQFSKNIAQAEFEPCLICYICPPARWCHIHTQNFYIHNKINECSKRLLLQFFWTLFWGTVYPNLT